MKRWVYKFLFFNVSLIALIALSLVFISSNETYGQTEEKNSVVDKGFSGIWQGLKNEIILRLCVNDGKLEGVVNQGDVIQNGSITSQSAISENELFIFVRGDKDKTAKVHLKLLGDRQLQINSESSKNPLMARKINRNKDCYVPIANNKAVTIVQGGVITSSGPGATSTGATVVQGGVITSDPGANSTGATVVQGGVITSGPGVVTPTPRPATVTYIPSVTPTPLTMISIPNKPANPSNSPTTGKPANVPGFIDVSVLGGPKNTGPKEGPKDTGPKEGPKSPPPVMGSPPQPVPPSSSSNPKKQDS